MRVDMLQLRTALERAWQPDTAYHGVQEDGNPALGQCYVSARVVQHYFPEAEIVEGEVQTPAGIDKHFWNLFSIRSSDVHQDLTWRQFKPGSYVLNWRVRDRHTLNDSEPTIQRVARLLERVQHELVAIQNEQNAHSNDS